MFLAVLLLSQARGEWVEISQQHYTKPARPYHPPFTTVSKPVMETKPNRIYINHSLPQYNWNTGVDDVPNYGNFENVQPGSSTVRRKPERLQFSPENHEQIEVKIISRNEHKYPTTIGPKHEIPRNKVVIIDEKRKDAGVNDVSNIGNFKNGQLEISTVRRKPERQRFDVESDEQNPKVDVIQRNEHIIGSTTVGPGHEIPRNRIVITDEKRKYTNRLPSAGIVQRVQLSTTKRPTNILTDFTDKPLEVLNLSDLEYTTDEDIISTIEIGNDATNFDQFTHKKHLTANVPIKEKPERNENNDDVNKQITKHDHADIELADRDQEVSVLQMPSDLKRVKAQTDTKPHSVDNKASNTAKTPPVEFVTRKELNSFPQYSDDLEPNRSADKKSQAGKIKRVQLVKNRTSEHPNYEFKRKPSIPNSIAVADKYPTEYDGNEDPHTDKIKSTHAGTTAKPMTVQIQSDKSNFKHYKLMQRPFAPSPEEVMLEEILKQDEGNIEDNVHHTQTKTGKVDVVQFSNKTIKGNQYYVETNDRPIIIKSLNNKTDQAHKSKPKNSTPHDEMIKTTNTGPGNLKAEHRDIHSVKSNKDIIHKNLPEPVHRIKRPLEEFVTESVIFTGFGKDIDNIYMKGNIEIVKQVHVTSTEEIPIRTTLKVKSIKNVIHEKEPPVNSEMGSYEYRIYHPKKTLLVPKPELVTQDESVTVENEKTANKFDDISDSNTKIDNRHDTSQNFNTVSKSSTNPQGDRDNNFKYDTGNNHENEEEVKSNDKTSDTNTNLPMENLVKFVKVVTETISKNTRRSFKGKIRYLEDLRDTLLSNIEERIDSAFPDERRVRRSRQERGHHVDFPSSESALMTISFLTFAVFLIKLVLQVIHTYKNKTMMVPAVMAAVGRALGDQRASPSKQ